MTNPAEMPSNTSTSYIIEGLTDEAVVEWLDEEPSYNGVLRVFRGNSSPESFTQAFSKSAQYRIIDGAEGPYSAIQGSEDTADRSKRSGITPAP